MGCRLKLVLAVAVFLGAAGLLGATGGIAAAGVPDPDLCTVPNVLTSPAHPSNALDYVVTVIGADGPIDSALVQLVFSTEAAGAICWCTGQTQPLLEDYTNASGQAVFQVHGGGCMEPALSATPPVQVFANGILLREVGIVSVDPVDAAGLRPTTVGYNPAGSCASGISDATFITPALKTGSIFFCTDLDSDGDSDVTDAVLFTPAIKTGYVCTEAP